MTDKKKKSDRFRELSQELTLRMRLLTSENLQEPEKTLDDLPGYKIVENIEMTLAQKKLVTIRTQIFFDAMEMRGFAAETIEAKDQELLNEILKDFNQMTMLGTLVNDLLKRTLERQGINTPLEEIRFVGGWQMAVKSSQSSKVLVDRDPDIDRRILLAQTMLDQARQRLDAVLDPLFGSRFTSKKKKPEDPPN